MDKMWITRKNNYAIKLLITILILLLLLLDNVEGGGEEEDAKKTAILFGSHGRILKLGNMRIQRRIWNRICW